MSTVGLADRILFRRATAAVYGAGAADKVDPHARWIAAFIALGIAVRLTRYLLRFPLWGDEAMLAMNFLDRDYAALMHPLDCHQVAPLLFLWTELTAVKLLGFSEWSLRLFPLLCSLASVFLFHRLARHLLRGAALVLAMGIFAVDYAGIRYAAEVKPYGVDLFISTLILFLTVRCWRRPDDSRRLWTLAAVVPAALGLSFPALFVAGGASLAMAAVLIGRPRRCWIAWAAYNVSLATSFVGWYWFGIRAQAQAELGVMSECWSDAFPPHDSLLKLAGWLLRAHAGPLLAVPVGGDHWGSAGTLLLCLIAAAVLLRQSRYRLLLLCAAPFALHLAAAWLRRYPYGGHMRLAMHVVPIASILAGIGAAAIVKWLARDRATWMPLPLPHHLNMLEGPSCEMNATRPAAAVGIPLTVAIVVLSALAILSTRDFYQPGKEQVDIRKRDFAAWFWGSLGRDHEVACTMSELSPALPPLATPGRGVAAPQFACNERIYSPRRVPAKPCDLALVSAERPLACVQYWSHTEPYDAAVFARWLDAMKQRYELAATARYPMLQDNDNDRQPEPADRVEVYEFVPRR